MVTMLVLLLVWALMVPAVLALARLLGRLSTASAPAEPAPPSRETGAGDNVVALVPRPQNRLDAPARRAA